MMQPPTDPPRDSLTETQVNTIIRDGAGLITSSGCELTDVTLTGIEDITGDTGKDGEIAHEAYATLHNRLKIAISRELPWGYAVLRPYFIMSYGSLSARFNMGAYFTNTPARHLGVTPVTYNIEGYDLLHGLDNSPGDAVAVDTGAGVISTIESMLAAQGYTKYIIDPSRRSTTIPKSRVWPLAEEWTWLAIINSLLGSIGYRGLWMDWNGYLRSEPYESPNTRAAEWAYNVTLTEDMLHPERVIEEDYFNAPNSWIAYQGNNVDGPMPTDGNGIYRYTNQYVGKTSVEARRRTITRKMSFDVTDHDALVAQALQEIDNDMRIKTVISAQTSPNPRHWHFDVLDLNDPEVGTRRAVLESAWTLPLNGGPMSHSWNVI